MQQPQASPEANPYAAPVFEEGMPAPVSEEEGPVTPRMVLLMRQSAPWVFFFGVIGFLLSALFAFGLVGSMSTMVRYQGSLGFGWANIVSFLMMAVLTAAAGTTSILLIRYGLKIRRFVDQPTSVDLASAFSAQRLLWRFTAIGLVLAFVAIIGLFIAMIMTLAAIDQA